MTGCAEPDKEDDMTLKDRFNQMANRKNRLTSEFQALFNHLASAKPESAKYRRIMAKMNLIKRQIQGLRRE